MTKKTKHLYILFEHASGYALVKISEFEDIGQLLPQVTEAVNNISKFNSFARLEAFSPFKSAANALENCNAVSEGIIHDDLKNFLINSLPAKHVILGVSERKLADAIKATDGLNIPCQCEGNIQEIVRVIRVHFPKLIKELSASNESKAQIGLGHSYSRAKVKFNVHRADNMIIQTINLLDQIDKDINTFSMRIREWFSYHFPELIKLVPENASFIKIVNLIGSRAGATEDKLDKMEEILMDSSKARAIVESAKTSMGFDVTDIDLENIADFSCRLLTLMDRRKTTYAYLESKMLQVAPSLSTLIGDQVAARLISHAGSLTNLAKFPASTVQILGAEKALFRALKVRSRFTPKYGLIFHSTFIGRAKRENKGKISRFLASKCSLASRIDCFNEVPNPVFGEHLRTQVEKRLEFFETGEEPPKNHEVMEEAVKEAAEYARKLIKKQKKAKRKLEAVDTQLIEVEHEEVNGDEPKKKKKKAKRTLEAVDDTQLIEVAHEEVNGDEPKKKKKKKNKN